jgi:hypothetical protein
MNWVKTCGGYCAIVFEQDAVLFYAIVVIIYSVLFMEWDTDDTAFHAVSVLCVLGIMRICILTNMVSPHRFGRNSLLVSGLYSPARHLLVREGIRRIIRRLSRARSGVHVDLCLTSISCTIFN